MQRSNYLLNRIGGFWRDSFRDVVLIVVSILIAFTLDAWWSNIRDQRRLERHLNALIYEFNEADHNLRRDQNNITRAAAATRAILEEMGRGKPQSFADSLAALFNTSFDAAAMASLGGALSTILSSGDIELIEDDSLSYLLTQWPLQVERLNSENAILTANREQELRMRFVALGVPESVVAAHLGDWLNLPPTRFRFDPNIILRDPGVESMLVARLIRFRFLNSQLDIAIAQADRILARLRRRK